MWRRYIAEYQVNCKDANVLVRYKMYALALKSVVTLKVHLFHEDQKVYKCGDTLVSFGLKVDKTADMFNSLALTGIIADTLIA